MRILATTPEANLARLPIALDLRALSVAEGVRAALSVAGIVAADQWLHWPPLLEAALGALLTCLCDSGGPIRRRLPALLIFTAVGAGFVILFGLARNAGLGVAVPLAILGVFACSFARVWGQAPLQVGNLLTVVLVLALDEPLHGHDAPLRAAVFAAGCLWATLLTMAIWRVHPFRPARRAVADTYRSLARLTADMRGLLLAAAAPEAWEAHARGHRRAVRDGVERARAAVQDTLRARGQASPRAFQALIRVEAADQLFGALIALSDLLEASTAEGGHEALCAAADGLLRLLRPALVVVAEAIAADDPGLGRRSAVGRLARIGTTLDELEAFGAADERLAPIVSAIVDRLRAAIMLTVPESGPPGALPAGRTARQPAGPRDCDRADQSELAFGRVPPRAAGRCGGGPGARVHTQLFRPVSALVDHHPDPDLAAVLRADLAARGGADCRHGGGRRAGGGDRPGLHHAARHRGGHVPAGGARLRHAGRQLRRVHLLPDAVGRAADGVQPARLRRVDDRGGAGALHGGGRPARCGRRPAAMAELGAGPPARRVADGAGSPCRLCRGGARLPDGGRAGLRSGCRPAKGGAGQQHAGDLDLPRAAGAAEIRPAGICSGRCWWTRRCGAWPGGYPCCSSTLITRMA